MRSLAKKKQKIALELLHLLYVNKLKYDSAWESWFSYLMGSENEWVVIDYAQVTNIAALIVSGLTKQRASIEETKILLQQIERWMRQSQGKLLLVQESKRKTKWYPACLVEGVESKDALLKLGIDKNLV